MTTKEINALLELNRKVGYAIGVLKGILIWDIPEELRPKIETAIKELENDN